MRRLDSEFSVSYRYSVHFTKGLFSPGNTLLRAWPRAMPRSASRAGSTALLHRADWQRVPGTCLHSASASMSHIPQLDQDLDRRESSRCILAGLDEFRQHLGGRLTIMLLETIGYGFEVHELDAVLVRESIAPLRALDHRLTAADPLQGGKACPIEELAAP